MNFFWKTDYSTVYWSSSPSPLTPSSPQTDHPCGAQPVPEISLLQIRNANYVLSRRRVNKVLKQQCLLRLSLQVPDGDYGTVQILVWPEIGALLNYGSHGEPVGMQRIDREVIPECWELWEGGGRQELIGEGVKICGSGWCTFSYKLPICKLTSFRNSVWHIFNIHCVQTADAQFHLHLRKWIWLI